MRLPRGFPEWGLAVGGAITLALLVLALVGEAVVGWRAVSNTVYVDGRAYQIPPLLPPGSTVRLGDIELRFPLGTDQLGRDVLARVVSGARFVLTVAFFSTALSALIGTLLGLISGFIGGMLDRAISLIMDSLYAFPGLILAIAIAAFLGVGVLNISLAIAVVYIPSYYRMVRGVVLSLKSSPFVEAAVVAGATSWSIVVKHILPNTLPQIVALLPVSFADAIITEAGLTFLGLGIEPPTPDWGFDLNKGRQFFLAGYWWIGLFPGIMIVLSVLGFLLMGEALNDLLNPRKVET